MKQYEVVVLGAGPGGYVAAIQAAQRGLSVAIVETAAVGGVCLNIGCIPTKTLVRNAEIIHLARQSAQRGIALGEPTVDMKQVLAMKNQVVKQLTMGVSGLLKANGVDCFMGFGRPTKHHTVQIEGEEPVEIGCQNLIIATGSHPATAPIPGADSPQVLDSTTLLNLDHVPEHLVVVGGGVVGCEFATIFRALGSRVTVVEMLPRLLANMDEEVSQAIARSFRAQKIDTHVLAKVTSIETNGGQSKVTIEKNGAVESVTCDAILLSTGRKANLAGLEALELELERGFVQVDECLRTSSPDVYAIGDVTGKLMLAHAASAMGVQVVDQLAGETGPVCLEQVPSCVFTWPEVGAVGLTEAEAKAQYGEVLVGRFPLMASGKALAMGETAGFYKVVADRQSQRLLGAHLVGAGATELVSTAAAYLAMGATLKDVERTIFAHPTLAEGFMEAAADALGSCVHLPPKSLK